MKKILIIPLLLLSLFSCDMSEIPNPLHGTYVLREEGTSGFYSAMFSFASDGTFRYIEIVEKEIKIAMEGTYSYNLSFFDFERANGRIDITLIYPDEILTSGIQNLIINHGSTSFLFDWEADKNTGPKTLTLVVSTTDRNQNYELYYYGNADKILSEMEDAI